MFSSVISVKLDTKFSGLILSSKICG